MDKSRQREIEKIAMDTVKACGSPEPLRNPVSICKHLGIPITTYSKDTADAYPDIYFSPAVTMNDDGVKTIVHAADCKSALPVAHELGHWILKHQKDGLIEESEADYFASILVAAKEPKPRIKRIAVSIIAAAVALALTASSAFMVGRASAPSEPAPAASSSQDNVQTATPSIQTQGAQPEPDNTEPPQTVTTHKGVVIGQEDTVYITPTGKRYHYLATCARGNAKAVTLAEAQSVGLTPCQTCIRPQD